MSEKPSDIDEVLGLDPADLDPTVRNRLTTYVTDREEQLVALRRRAVEAENEVAALERKIEELQVQRDSLTEQFQSPSDDIPVVDPTTVFSALAESIRSEPLADTGFTVGNLSVDLRANVVQTDKGVQLHLPSPGTAATAGLSEFHFDVVAEPTRPELGYETVPDLLGLDRASAVAAIERVGFELGRDEREPADAPEGTVIEQLPSPFSLAEPGAAIDIVAAEPGATVMADLLGRSLPDAVQFIGDRYTLRDITAVDSDAPPGTVLDQDPAPGSVLAETAGVSLTISAFREAPAEGTDPKTLVEMDVTEVNGIGETYGERLRAAGYATLADLVDAEPVEIAEIADVSLDRARDWIEVVHHLGTEADDEKTP